MAVSGPLSSSKAKGIESCRREEFRLAPLQRRKVERRACIQLRKGGGYPFLWHAIARPERRRPKGRRGSKEKEVFDIQKQGRRRLHPHLFYRRRLTSCNISGSQKKRRGRVMDQCNHYLLLFQVQQKTGEFLAGRKPDGRTDGRIGPIPPLPFGFLLTRYKIFFLPCVLFSFYVAASEKNKCIFDGAQTDDSRGKCSGKERREEEEETRKASPLYHDGQASILIWEK